MRAALFALGLLMIGVAANAETDLEAIGRLNRDGKFALAEAASRTMLRGLEARGESESMPAAEALDELAIALRRGGKASDPDALKACEQALRIKRRLVGVDDLRTADSLHNLGLLYYSRGKPDQAMPRLEEALAIRERIAGPSSPAVAKSLLALASVRTTLGSTVEASGLVKRAIEIQRTTLAEKDPERITGLTVYAGLLYQTGEFAAAIPIYEEAITLLKPGKGSNGILLGACYYSLGSVNAELGDHLAARDALTRALDLRERTLGAAHPMVGNTLVSLAETRHMLGENRAARADYERAIRVLEKALGPDHPDLAWALMKFGWLRLDSGSPDGAAILLRRALGIQEAALGSESPALWMTLRGLARAAATKGEIGPALEYQRRAISIAEGAYGRYHPDVAMTRAELADLLLRAGRFAEAADASVQASLLGTELLRLATRGLAERQALLYAADRGSALDAALEVVGKTQTDLSTGLAARVLDAVIRNRAVVLDEMAERQQDLAATGKAAAASEKLEGARRKLARLLVMGAAASSGVRPEEIGRARKEVEKAERDLGSASSVFRAQRARDRAGLSEVEAALPRGCALVSIANYGAPDSRSYVAFVLKGGGTPPQVMALGHAATIEPCVNRWRALLGVAPPSKAQGAAERDRATREAGRLVRERVWDPLTPFLRDVRTVFMVRDGALHAVNFDALPVGKSGFLAEDAPLIHSLASERDLVGMRRGDRIGRGILAVGGVSYDRVASGRPAPVDRGGSRDGSRALSSYDPPELRGSVLDCGDFGKIRFPALPASALEVKDIAALAPDRSGTKLLMGVDADESHLRRLVVGRRIVHLATHGFFLTGDCTDADALPGVSRGIGGISSSKSTKPTALRLAGLALAGANQRADSGPDADDGILTAEEVASLNLAGVEWAVLSACDTGAGDVQIGEGVLGLQRAFEIAGAHTLIMSLWSVEDESARAWMHALYRYRLKEHAGTAQAVRDANLRVLRERRAQGLSTHPFYWAAFIATGSWT